MSTKPGTVKIHNRAFVRLNGAIIVDGKEYPLELQQSPRGAVSLTYKAGGKSFEMAFGTNMLGESYRVDLAPKFHIVANTIRNAIDNAGADQ